MTAAQERPGKSTLTGIGLKIASVAVFVGMSTQIKLAGDLPVGQIVFFRSLFALPPIMVFLWWHGEFWAGMRTNKFAGHFNRGFIGVLAMGFSFFAVTHLPLPEAITLNYAQPLLVVIFSAVFLREVVRAYRWTAVVIGLIGVIIVSWPNLTLLTSPEGLGAGEAAGVLAALGGAAMAAVAMLLVRNLVKTEKSATIVIWFSINATLLSLLTIPFGWLPMTTSQVVLLVGAGICGGIAQIFMTEAYRYAEASTVAPFEYASLLISVVVGYVVFAYLPTLYTLTGGLIIVGSGIYIIFRERQLGIQRAKARKASTPQ